jgi:hypothetical protein
MWPLSVFAIITRKAWRKSDLFATYLKIISERESHPLRVAILRVRVRARVEGAWRHAGDIDTRIFGFIEVADPEPRTDGEPV